MSEPHEPLDFIRAKVKADLQAGAYPSVVTRFPPEPNGYLHVGHAKAICADFGIAAEFGGRCNLRFDDTNPATEETEYVESIQADIRWLGFEWEGEPLHASEYFGRLYDYAEQLILKGLAYVDSSTEEDVRTLRGTVTEPGRRSEYADRTVDENLDLFRRMAAGEFAEGEHVLRARIDMANDNMKMRDPLIYRIKHAKHHHTGDDWHVYPLYDFAHCLSDSIEGVTHSMCTLEFDVNRALYDWFLEQLTEGPRPHQYEFARLELTYIITSKRRLKALVDGGHVDGWDDPRMPTLAGMRRLGYPPAAIRALMARVGISKSNSLVEYGWLEDAVREELNARAPRAMAVLRPLKLVITNWAEDTTVDVPTWPQDPDRDEARALPFGREVWIDQADFEEVPPRDWKRLAPGREVRLRSGFLVTANSVIMKDGEVIEVRCTADLASRGGRAPDGRKVRGTIHWVPVEGAVDAEVRLYDRLFADEVPGEGKDSVFDSLNPKSLEVVTAKVEPSLAAAQKGDAFQFERLGYFVVDSTEGGLVFNRTVTLRDSWAKDKPVARKARDPQGGGGFKPALPAAAQGLVNRHAIADDHARVLTGDKPYLELFQGAVEAGAAPRTVARLIVDELRKVGEGTVSVAGITALAERLDGSALPASAARPVLGELLVSDEPVDAIVERLGLAAADSSAVDAAVDAVLAANPDEVARYRAGDQRLTGFFIGQVMRALGGKAEGQAVRAALAVKLG